jgi:hypothetical protein
VPKSHHFNGGVCATAGKHSKNQPAAMRNIQPARFTMLISRTDPRLADQSFSLFAGATSNELREDNNVPSTINRRNRA